jgi:hypothetical protein
METKQEAQMTHFTFRCGGYNFNVKAADRLSAMVDANKHFCPSHGAWFERGLNQYEWVSGNFFD